MKGRYRMAASCLHVEYTMLMEMWSRVVYGETVRVIEQTIVVRKRGS